MPIPNLIHPVPVTIVPILREATRFDDDAREPVQAAARDDAGAVTIDGQLSQSLRTGQVRAGRTGRVEDEGGYVLFRYFDLEAAGLVTDARPYGLLANDRITSIAGKPTGLYVRRCDPMGTYSGLGFTLVKAYLEDRDPAKDV